MNVSQLFTDDDAVSPVIGVILMVAITVILAAVIGAFVLNIGGSQETAPQATIDFTEKVTTSNDYTYVEVAHEGGAPLETASVYVQAGDLDKKIPAKMEAGSSFYVYDTDSANDPGGETRDSTDPDTMGTNPVKDSLTQTIKIVWESQSSDKSSIIGSYSPN